MKEYLSPTLVRFGSVQDLTHGGQQNGICKAKENGAKDGMTDPSVPGPWGKVVGEVHDAFCGMSRS